jgi:hypothetical protein
MNTNRTAQLIKKTHSILQQEQDLSPHNQLINTTLSGLVSCLSDSFFSSHSHALAVDQSLENERQQLPKLCGAAECAMENYWAEKFLSYDVLSPDHLKEFWYYNNYEALWSLEKHLIGPMTQSHIVFLGSGPLPLTAIIAALQDPSYQITCVDYDSNACVVSQKLIAKLGLSDQINVVESMATHYNFSVDDFVICASLIKDKTELYDTMWEKGVTDFVVRDAEGSYCFLYEPSPLPEKKYYTEKRRTIPNRMCINTTRYFSRTL